MRYEQMCRKLLLVAVCGLFLLGGLSGCGEEITITIQDAGEQTQFVMTSGKKVKKALEEAGITLGDEDEVSLDLDSRLKEDTSIQILRKATVSVVYEEETTEVTLVGATVEDAIQEAGITLQDKDFVDAALEDYITDGMTITISEKASVKLTLDGKTEDVYTSAETVEDFLSEQDITLGEDDRIEPSVTSKIKEGMKIVVQRVEIKEETVTEEIDYDTTTQNSSSMAAGTTSVKQKGVKGEKQVTYTVTYVDGKEESREVKDEKVTTEPVDEIVLKGTKQERTVVSKEYYDDCDGSGHGVCVITYSDGSTERQEY